MRASRVALGVDYHGTSFALSVFVEIRSCFLSVPWIERLEGFYSDWVFVVWTKSSRAFEIELNLKVSFSKELLFYCVYYQASHKHMSTDMAEYSLILVV